MRPADSVRATRISFARSAHRPTGARGYRDAMIRSGTIFGPHQTTVYAGPGSNRYSRSPIESDTVRRMRASPAEYLRLDLRAHDLLREVPLYDVSIVDLPAGGAGRSGADIRALESAAAPSRVANTIYGLRHFLGLRRIRRAWRAAYGTTA
jgi:hypothetical protein